MMDFNKLKNAVAAQFQRMQEGGQTLYRARVDKDTLWETYLTSFPPGTNPLYCVKTEHDCSSCRQFIKAVGNVAAIQDNKLISIWDIQVDEPAYQTVADVLSALVKGAAIDNLFLSMERTAGTDRNFEPMVEGVKTWGHFFINIPRRFVVRGDNIGAKLSDYQALHDVLKRSLNELSIEAADTVLDLIAQNSLYRGEENKHAVTAFKNLKKEYECVPMELQDNFIWKQITQAPPSVSRIRNTAIGALLIDLSSDVNLEEAVRKFESVVSPVNYKRPTAAVTKEMVEKAKETIEGLGLTSALERRYARISDININDILFVDRAAKKNLAGNVFDDIAAGVADKKPKNMDKVEEVPIEKFLKDIMPTAAGIELMLENSNVKNLVSLIAPADPTAGFLFKWQNNFTWTYNGDMTDSLKEKVKAAGGNVTGDLCCRLAWYNYDDLDLHMIEPTWNHIYYGSNRLGKGRKSACGGILDVDMNAGGGKPGRGTREPVENIFYETKRTMMEGIYHLYVHQYCRKESKDVGFEAEIDFMGDVYHFAYDKAVNGNVTVAKIEYSRDNGIKIIESLPGTTISKNVWGLTTGKFHKVNIVMLSPNHWESTGSAVGNRHYFFMLDGCVNPEPARGFFNEFLKEELNEHRKVFEIVGSKMIAAETDDQLSGLGFSSTQRNNVLCKVHGSFNRVIKITF